MIISIKHITLYKSITPHCERQSVLPTYLPMVSQNNIIISLSSAMLLFMCTASNSAAQTQDKSNTKRTDSNTTYSPAQNGYLGLNTIPNARTDPTGTLRTGVNTLDPYLNAYISAQIADPLSLTFRQTSEVSSLTGDAKKLYPGVDLKLRLLKENTFRPAIALGIQSALGHKRMAGEYLALSKRYNNFDFTAGLGWGRFGTARHFKNPLSGLSSHFNKDRDYNSEMPNKPSNWFTGEDIGFFGGAEYFLPPLLSYDGFSVKFDYGADRYVAEKAVSDYKNASVWGLGLAYSHNNWLSAGVGIQGTDKVMGRLSIQGSPARWPLRAVHYNENPRPIYKKRPSRTNVARMLSEASRDNIDISDIWTNEEETHLLATIHLPDGVPAPKHVGRAARHIINNTQNSVEKITLTLQTKALRGTRISLMRSDIEKALRNKNSSANEIWQNANIESDNQTDAFLKVADDKSAELSSPPKNSPFLPLKYFSVESTLISEDNPPSLRQRGESALTDKAEIRLILDNQIGLSEEDSGLLRRSSLVIEGTTSPFLGFFSGASLRLNLNDNLENVAKLRPVSSIPVRSDINDFTDRFISLDRAHLSYMHSITPQLHAALSTGYLEESYAGFGGQIIYRPIHSRFAVGGELWQAYRRDPNTQLNLALNGTQVTTGHAHLWYDVPYYDITAKLSAGRYLLGDTGFSVGLEKNFYNGVILSASTTLTDAADADLYGGTTHSYHSLNLSLPLGSLPYIPSGSEIHMRNAPFGRDSAQSLDKPIDLYKLTQKFTINDIARHWPEITD